MILRFLGSGDAFGSGGRFQACLLLVTGGGDVLLDCGATSLTAMKRAGVDPSRIGWVLLSHLHGDHFGGLPFLILDGQFARRERPLVIAGPPGTRERVEAAMEVFFPGSVAARRRFPVTFAELEPHAPAAVGPVRVTAYPAEHASGAPSYALRVAADGATVAYSGDTAWTDELVACSDEADVFVCEAYFRDKPVPYHLSLDRLVAEAGRLTCRRIMLTHMSADMLAAVPEGRPELGGREGPSELAGRNGRVPLDRAADGLTLRL